jgi:hypothetical protein
VCAAGAPGRRSAPAWRWCGLMRCVVCAVRCVCAGGVCCTFTSIMGIIILVRSAPSIALRASGATKDASESIARREPCCLPHSAGRGCRRAGGVSTRRNPQTLASHTDWCARVWRQSVVSHLIDSEYPFLQKELFLHLDKDGSGLCSRGEGCMCEDGNTTVPCDAAGNAAQACMYGAIMYVVTLGLSAGCCVLGKTKKTTGVGGPM